MHLGTGVFGNFRHSRTGTQALEALEHLGLSGTRAPRHLDTRTLKALGHMGTQGTLFRRLCGHHVLAQQSAET